VLGISGELQRRRRRSVQIEIGVGHGEVEPVSAEACRFPGAIRAGAAYRQHRSW
jgi:hypothetical protein